MDDNLYIYNNRTFNMSDQNWRWAAGFRTRPSCQCVSRNDGMARPVPPVGAVERTYRRNLAPGACIGALTIPLKHHLAGNLSCDYGAKVGLGIRGTLGKQARHADQSFMRIVDGYITGFQFVQFNFTISISPTSSSGHFTRHPLIFDTVSTFLPHIL
jgi:hypothetical protein